MSGFGAGIGDGLVEEDEDEVEEVVQPPREVADPLGMEADGETSDQPPRWPWWARPPRRDPLDVVAEEVAKTKAYRAAKMFAPGIDLQVVTSGVEALRAVAARGLRWAGDKLQELSRQIDVR